MKKISSKIMLAITLSCLIVSIFVAAISLIGGKRILEKEAKDKLFNLINLEKQNLEKNITNTEQLAKNIEGLIESTIELNSIKNDPDKIKEYKQEMEELIVTFIKKSGNRSGWMIFDSQVIPGGHVLSYFDKDQDGTPEKQPEYDVRELDFSGGKNAWWSEAEKNGTYWTNPYYWKEWNATIMSYSRAVYIGNQFIGVCGSDFVFSDIKKELSSKTLYDSGFLALTDENLNTLIHPALEGKNLKEISDQEGIEELKEYFTSKNFQDKVKIIKYNNKKNIVASSKLSNNWVLSTTVPVEEVFSGISKLRLYIFLIVIAALIVAGIVSYLIGNKMSGPIRETTEMLTELAEGEGDLTIRLNVKSKDEIGEMSTQMNKFLDHMQKMIRNIVDLNKTFVSSAKTLSSNSEILNQNTDNIKGQVESVAAAAEEMNLNIESITSSTTESSAQVKEVAENSSNMSMNINTLASATEEASTNFSDINDKVNKITEKMTKISENINDINESTNNSATAIEEMSSTLGEISRGTNEAKGISEQADSQANLTIKSMKTLQDNASEVGKVINIINDIADQTNMLALNATIEAASAGDAGKGFAVVANEVKELAKQTAEATNKIAKRIQEMQSSTNESVDSINKISDIIDKLNNINQTIATSLEEQTVTINEISQIVARSANSSHEVNDFSEDILKTVQIVNKNINEANIGLNDISQSISQISSQSRSVSEKNDNLDTAVSDISRRTNEMNQGVNEISENLSNISKSTEDTAQNSNEVYSLSEKIDSLANQLNKLIAKFKI